MKPTSKKELNMTDKKAKKPQPKPKQSALQFAVSNLMAVNSELQKARSK